RRHTRLQGDWSSDVCSSDLAGRHRAVRMQKLIAWRDQAVPAQSGPAEQRVHRVLAESAGTVALGSLLKAAAVSRAVVQRLVKEGKLVVSEEPLVPEQVPFAIDLIPPANLLNAEQTHVLEASEGW